MEGGWVSKCSSRLSAAYMPFSSSQDLGGWRAAPFEHVVLALAPQYKTAQLPLMVDVPGMVFWHSF
eukprot:3556350-Pyramimonas_sp.AAC.1